jgi:epoxide hydrolase A/B
MVMSGEALRHRFVETNGIRMHIAETGEGPLVLLLHGFPESWYAWRHQFRALVAAGYRLVAPDLRGYGQTDRPVPVEAYDIFQLTGDIVGLLQALGEERAVIVGHDWGAWIAAHLALLRQDLCDGLVLLSVPFVPRRKVSQSQWEQQAYPAKVFYQADLRSPIMEQYLRADIRGTLLRALYSLSGDAALEERFHPVRDPGPPPMAATPARLPAWLTEHDLDFLEGEFKRSGFSGPLKYYRNMDRNWVMTPFLDGAKIPQPTLFVAGAKDPVVEFLRPEFDTLETNVPHLTKKVLLPEIGHWIQQEAPADVNGLLIEFLAAAIPAC